jgi:simple sugar transport system permease protein
LEVNLSEEKEELQAPRTQEQAPTEEERSLVQRIFVRRGIFSALVIPVLAVFTAFLIGGLIIAISTPDVLLAWSKFFQAPLEALRITWQTVWGTYLALFEGAFGNPKEIIEGFRIWFSTGDPQPLYVSLRPLGESLVLTTPYIFAGLAVALGFRGGLFNIGVEGQLFVGGLASAFVGYSLTGLPTIIHLPLAVLAGLTAGGIWGAIPGILKARTGAHEVINTIMMNWIAFRLTDYLLSGPMARPDGLPITPQIKPTAFIPTLLPPPVRIHWGFFIALGAAVLVYWFLWKTPRGLEIRMTGSNPHAARYAGIRIAFITVLTMTLSGALGGMTGTVQILAVDHQLVRAFSVGYGFDSIALALLGNSHPLGVVLASLLFGFMRGGASRMQSVAGTPVEIIRIIQGLVIVFIAAPEIIRSLYRLKPPKEEEEVVITTSWGS